MMMNSQYSIHGLSRMEPWKSNDLLRFNMPSECGISFGIKLSDPNTFIDKKFLILEKEKYRYQKVISDISGNDIKSHQNDPQQVIKVIRDWFKPVLNKTPFHKEIWLAYNEFEYDYAQILKDFGYESQDINALTFSDIIDITTEWVEQYKSNKFKRK